MLRRIQTGRFWLIVGVLLPTALLHAAPKDVHGRIERHGDLQVVRVWGTPQEMGFAHGYLLAGEIALSINETVTSFFGTGARYAATLESVRPLIQISEAQRKELAGVLEGVAAHFGRPPLLKAAGRPVELDDLVLLNAMDMLRGLSCSGFTIWGEKAGSAGVITTRNFDFNVTGRVTGDSDRILVREPAGRRKVASVAPPGYIGVFTGVNEDGVCFFLHDGDGPRDAGLTRPNRPLALALAELAERASPVQAQARARETLGALAPYRFSYMVRVVGPRIDENGPPERVYRVDARSFGENAGGDLTCVTTNHYVEEAYAPHSGSVAGVTRQRDDSGWRHQTLLRRLDAAPSSTQLWEALAEVSADQRGCTTLHSLVVYPEQKRLEIAFGRADDTIIPAPKRTPTRLSFEAIFTGTPPEREPELAISARKEHGTFVP